MDLDLLPWDRLTVVDYGPEVRLGPHMDHGLEDGVGPMPLVGYKMAGPIGLSQSIYTSFERGKLYQPVSSVARAEECEEDLSIATVKETIEIPMAKEMTDDHSPQSGSRSTRAGRSGSQSGGSQSKRKPMISMQEILNMDEQEGSSRRNKAGKNHYSTALKFFDEDQAERASMIFDVNYISPLACLPSTEVDDFHSTHLGTQELHQNLQEGWILVVKNHGKRKSKADCTSVPSSSSPPVTAKQVAMTRNEIKKGVADSSIYCESNSSEWLNSKIMICGKAVGVTVGNNETDWARMIEFAQGRDRINTIAREEERSKKRVVRELQSLRSSIDYEKSKGKSAVGMGSIQNIQSSKVQCKGRR
eukprot:TRINITY_DN13795_c0_g1_i4.p1 TRINITY_DN13795_c0_g1~~TRINITY_DN13795_c0_g1_i4.p1  ORF type:complete len:360 (-),score=51.98 TRINITY_DN13795_c0_g1_i4:463-1542(-)